ncbi:hypothetical protein [Salinirubrum litoreum]|uniref:Uncharacterized protein n=1 Tax=Salinirubrum litoreum TaxID=1126234 RepID=A0ABD5RCZ8_9EURY|nr:hypothetical protein [Salinirubrum litoreum]
MSDTPRHEEPLDDTETYQWLQLLKLLLTIAVAGLTCLELLGVL